MTKPKEGPRRKSLALAEEGKETVDLIGYLRSCSDPMLEQFELARLSTSQNLMKDLNHIMQRAVNDLGEALLARTLREHRKALAKQSVPFQSAQEIIAELMPALPHAPRSTPKPEGKRRMKDE
jgi:hypothetical protein